jgi:microcystin degradation protein MlrC
VERVRLPIVPPTVTMLTEPGAPNRPYGELIDLGQELMRTPPWAGKVLNVSVMGGFAYGDTPYNGLTTVVTATDRATARALALEIAKAGWARRGRFHAHLTTIEDAVRLALGTRDRSKPALIFADVADNPGGGGRGDTMFILSAFHAAGVRDAVLGLIHDPLLAAEAHRRGVGANFTAHFNRDPSSDFTLPFQAPATVVRLHPGPVLGRRGIYAGSSMDMGPAAALKLDGITVLVTSERFQCADPAFLETFGIDIASERVVVVKSRGHFRGGFDEFFAHAQVVEVDAPGLTSPMLSHFRWRHLPRPVVPLDAHVTWSPEAPG